MSGRFMKTKKIVISALTMAVIASQLMGCAAVGQNELLEMLNNGESIEIEVMAPVNSEQGTLQQLEWVQLDQIQTYKDFTKTFDDTLKIVAFGDNSKNGVVYIDVDGNQTGNNTLYNGFMNRKFISTYWENEEIQSKLQDSILSVYADLEEGSSVLPYAVLNAYYNILPDSEPNYFNADSTLSRAEFLSAVMRAETPVTDNLSIDESFASSVGESEYNLYASQMQDYSYLDINSKSLNNQTYNGTITRAEAIYTLVQKYFSEEYKAVDVKTAETYSDVKNAGDIASQQGYSNEKEYWKAYELTYSIQNPDKGLPQDLYKAMLVAKQVGIISSDSEESRWDEGLTKGELIELLVNTYESIVNRDGYKVDAMFGKGSDGIDLENSNNTTDTIENDFKATTDLGDLSEEELEKKLEESANSDLNQKFYDPSIPVEEQINPETGENFKPGDTIGTFETQGGTEGKIIYGGNSSEW